MTIVSLDKEMEQKEHETPPGLPIPRNPTDVKLRIFIPARAVLVPLPGATDVGFAGDNRNFSYDIGTSRAELWVDVSNIPSSSHAVTIKRRAFGQSEKYRAEDLESVGGKPIWWKVIKKDPFLHQERPPIAIATAKVTDDSLAVTGWMESQPLNPQQVVHLKFHTNAALPLDLLAPAINCDLDVLLLSSAAGLSYSIKGLHDGFPAYELYLEQKLVYSYDPVTANSGPLSLEPPANVSVDIPWTTVSTP
jgi:hypothetical protein